MKIAIPHWQGRVSPVLDVAGALLVVETDHGQETGRQSIAMTEDSFLDRARRIKDLDIDTLICGAISRPLELALTSFGIEVIAQTCGEIHHVLEAFLTGRLQREMYLMPGCCRRQRRFRMGNPNGGRHGWAKRMAHDRKLREA